ncbi:DUF1361 domain-containing protein [Chitinophaga vietnamensis]|uniref:DUF1361 domain-containing protein n=1 Tax=Chitinophaga vietnamensis TaxID=2593957 RepID=UPI0011784A30|nr:DUF1361 domain-containing protein [Chitinophaga vietnamensis]
MHLRRIVRLVRVGLHRPGILHLLYASMAFGLLLLIFRIAHTGSMLRASLAWNLFLAYVPYGITRWMERHPAAMKDRYNWYGCFVIWLLFIPNAPYIITDLFHLFDGGVPLWFELFVIFSFAWNGLVLGYLSINSMEKMWRNRYSRWPAWLFTFPVMFLCGLGVYIGRYLRYNSWDMVKDPLTLMRDIGNLFLHPWEYRAAWAFTICMGISLSLMYPFIRKLQQPQ